MEGYWGGGRGGRGMSVLAIILHRFTLVRDGRAGNEVWDLGVAACACLCLIAFWTWADVSPVCVMHRW